MSEFWDVIATQLKELESAKSAVDVTRILSQERNPYGREPSTADGFFAGSGGDGSVEEALLIAGWSTLWREAGFHYAMTAPDGSAITYVEGDIYRGNLSDGASTVSRNEVLAMLRERNYE